MSTTRRSFLATGAAAGAAAAGASVPLLGAQTNWLEAAANAAAPSDSVLVIVQMRGGWDQLNMIAEIDHPKFQAARPNLGIRKAKALQIANGSKHYWHPSLADFKTLYDRGDLAVLQNIGYAKPNLSHFVSEKKWFSADPTSTTVDEGWLATYLKKAYKGNAVLPAINFERRLNKAFLGVRVPVFTNPVQFQYVLDTNKFARVDNILQLQTLVDNANVIRPGASPNLMHVAVSTNDAISDSGLIQSTGKNYKPSANANYPTSGLSTLLQRIARYITGGLKTKIYLTSQGGWDSHANQILSGAPETGSMADRLALVSSAIRAFLDDMKGYNQHKRVVVMAFSEFGRRLGENGSLGTDHGHGGVAFLAGDPVRGGMFGKAPDLSLATTPYNRYYIPFNGNSMDFRRMYAEVLTNWLGVADHSVVLGSKFPLLGAL